MGKWAALAYTWGTKNEKQGFTLFDIAKAYRARSPILSVAHPGQLLWGDAFYFRNLIEEGLSPHLKTLDRILKLVCIERL